MRAGLNGCVAAAAVLLHSAVGAAAEPERTGFTGDLGLGAALTTFPVTYQFSSPPGEPQRASETTRETRFGLAPLSLSLGGFLNPTVALLFRMAGTSYFEDGDQYGSYFYGPIAEVWLNDTFYVSGGVGLGLYGANALLSPAAAAPEAGLAFDIRAGAALISGRDHALTLSLEVVPAFYESAAVQGYALVLAWKWF